MDHKFDIFISYSQNDVEIAYNIADLCKSYGFDCWIANNNLIGGDNWRREIYHTLDQCSTVLLVATTWALQSKEVKKELDYAIDHQKPVVIVTFPRIEIPKPYREYARIELQCSLLLDDTRYVCLNRLLDSGLFPSKEAVFNPHIILARSLNHTKRARPRNWRIFHESYLGQLTKILSPFIIIALFPLILFSVPENSRLTFFIVVVVVAFLVLLLVSLGRNPFISQLYYMYIDAWQSLRIIRLFPERAVLTPQGFVIRRRQNSLIMQAHPNFQYDYWIFRQLTR